MEVHEKIKVMRLFKKLTQEDMARELGYESVHGYAKLERGKVSPTFDRLEEIAKILKVSVKDLLGLNEGNIVNIAGNCHYGAQNVVFLSESQCAQELEKTQMLLQERNKEVDLLKVQIKQLMEIIELMKAKEG